MVIFLYNQYIFVRIQQFWGPPLNRLISEPSYIKTIYYETSYKDVPVFT